MGVIGVPLSCRGCSQSLLNQPLDGVCPHCGRSIGETLNLRVIDPEALAISGDVPCAGCTYNLRTLYLSGKCPECGQAVIESLHHDRLCFAEPGWLGNLRWGVNLHLIWLLGPALLGLGMVAAAVCSSAGAVPQSAYYFQAIGCGGILLFCILWVVWTIGVFLICEREPAPGALIPKVQKLAEVSAILFPVFAVLSAFTWVAGSAAAFYPVLLIATLLTVLTLAAYGAASTAVSVCLRQVAKRAKQGGLVKLIKSQMVISIAIWTVLFFCLIGEMCTFDNNYNYVQREFAHFVIFTAIILALASLLTSYVLALIIFFRMKAILKEACKSAPQPVGEPAEACDPQYFA